MNKYLERLAKVQSRLLAYDMCAQAAEVFVAAYRQFHNEGGAVIDEIVRSDEDPDLIIQRQAGDLLVRCFEQALDDADLALTLVHTVSEESGIDRDDFARLDPDQE